MNCQPRILYFEGGHLAVPWAWDVKGAPVRYARSQLVAVDAPDGDVDLDVLEYTPFFEFGDITPGWRATQLEFKLRRDLMPLAGDLEDPVVADPQDGVATPLVVKPPRPRRRAAPARDRLWCGE